MAFTAHASPTGWQKPSSILSAIYAPRRLLGLLHKMSWVAINLISIRVLSVSGLIIALWLCPVQVFAHLGLYLAAVNLATLAVFGRYELLVVAAPSERQAADAVHLCIVTGIRRSRSS